MIIDIKAINKKQCRELFKNGASLPLSSDWFSPSHYIPEPNEPILMAIQNLKTGDMSFEIGYADWVSPFNTEEIHDLPKDIDVYWYADSCDGLNTPDDHLIAWTALVWLWRDFTTEFKVKTSYRASVSKNFTEFDPQTDSKPELETGPRNLD